jgi:hypothetical protein
MTADLEHLQPGDRVIYYTGSLASDRRAKKSPAALAAADEAWRAALAGRVDLLQHRLPDGRLEYIAIRRRAVDKRPVEPAITPQRERRVA